jgi:DnaJ family protein C protein 9
LEGIAEKKLKKFKKFDKDSPTDRQRRRQAAEKEAEEAEKVMQEMGLELGPGQDDELKALIQNRQKSRMNTMIESLESKYAEKPPSKRKGKVAEKGSSKKGKPSEPTEEEFQAIQAKLFQTK